jgi:hypothetical protein
LTVSLAVVMLFSGVLLANRSNQDVLFRALGNLAEVVHLVETEYVDELNQEALALSLDAGLVEPLNRSAAVLPVDRIGDYLEFVESPPPYGVGLASRLGSAAVQYVFPGSPAEAAGLQTWEVIELVEGVNSRGRPLWQIRLELKDHEKRGEPVRLTVFDREVDERREVVLEPLEWTLRPATAEERDGVTIIEVEAVPEDAVDAIASMTPKQGQVVLDLRKLRWGLETETIALADVVVAFDHARRVLQVIAPVRPGGAPERAYDAALARIDGYLKRIDEGPRGAGLGAVGVAREVPLAAHTLSLIHI